MAQSAVARPRLVVHLRASTDSGRLGCGAVGIDSGVLAGIFRELLTTTFASAFEQVAFATTDWSQKQRFIGPFRRAFGW
jgi:hypothetical protein